MKKSLLTGLIILSLASLWSCSGLQTRRESDHYTIAEKDTTSLYEQMNAPGNRDNGIIYPSSRTIKSERYVLLKDSTVDRDYPNFIRLGLYESVGLIGSGNSDYSGDYGLFGIFPDLRNIKPSFKGTNSGLFQGTIMRYGIGEWRLRWFRDAKNWTIGTNIVEIIKGDVRHENSLYSVFPLYIKKRWYLREEIPYIALTPGVGIGWYPSQYINLSGAIEVGSLGGLNIRGFIGYAVGRTPNFRVGQEEFTTIDTKSYTPSIPYIGIGISFLDFHNLVPETYREWKNHEHSAWNIGLAQLTMLGSTADKPFFNDSNSSVISGFNLRIANSEIAIPILNNKFYAGTSLANFLALGQNEWGFSILPIKLGYFTTVLADELSTEPFIEYNYYPSKFIHIGNKLNLRISDNMNIGLVLGYAVGTTDITIIRDQFPDLEYKSSFDRPYIGITIGFMDRIFFPEELRYNKKK